MGYVSLSITVFVSCCWKVIEEVFQSGYFFKRLQNKQVVFNQRPPNTAVPTLTMVLPACTAASKSALMPIDKVSN
jgi:hypothetical protein